MSEQAVEGVAIPEDVEAAYTVNLKTSANHDSGMLTIRAMDAEQLKERLVEVQLTELVPTIIAVEKELQAAEAATRPAGSSSQSGGSGGGTSDSGVKYHPEGKKCEKCSEAVVYKEIKTKAGKTYKLWSCPNQSAKGDGHESTFI